MLTFSNKSIVLLSRYQRVVANGRYRRANAAAIATPEVTTTRSSSQAAAETPAVAAALSFDHEEEPPTTQQQASATTPSATWHPIAIVASGSHDSNDDHPEQQDDDHDYHHYDHDKRYLLPQQREREQQWKTEFMEQNPNDKLTLRYYHHHRMVRHQYNKKKQQLQSKPPLYNDDLKKQHHDISPQKLPYHEVDSSSSTVDDKLRLVSSLISARTLSQFRSSSLRYRNSKMTRIKSNSIKQSSSPPSYHGGDHSSSMMHANTIVRNESTFSSSSDNSSQNPIIEKENQMKSAQDRIVFHDTVHDEVRDDAEDAVVAPDVNGPSNEVDTEPVNRNIERSQSTGHGRIWKSDDIYNPEKYDTDHYHQRFHQQWHERFIDYDVEDLDDDDDSDVDDTEPRERDSIHNNNNDDDVNVYGSTADDEFMRLMMIQQSKKPFVSSKSSSLWTENGVSSSTSSSPSMAHGTAIHYRPDDQVTKTSHIPPNYHPNTKDANQQHEHSGSNKKPNDAKSNKKLYKIDDIVDKVIRKHGSIIRPQQYGLGVLHADPSMDIQLLIDNYTVKSIASALREREDALQQAALLASNPNTIDELLSFLQIYHPDYVLRNRKQRKEKRTIAPSSTASSTLVDHHHHRRNSQDVRKHDSDDPRNQSDITTVGTTTTTVASHLDGINVTDDDYDNVEDNGNGKSSSIPRSPTTYNDWQQQLQQPQQHQGSSKATSTIFSLSSSSANYDDDEMIMDRAIHQDNNIVNPTSSSLDKTDPIYSLQYPECRNVLRKSLMRMPRTITSAHKKRAGVCIALCLCYNVPSILLQRRSKDLRSYPNEVCLPGGMVCDIQDPTIVSTSIREMKEEIGGLHDTIHHPIEVLGILRLNWGDVQHITGVAVTPVVCYIGELPDQLYPNPDEVSEIFTIPLRDLLKREYWIHRDGLAPIFVGGPYVIWGLTGYIIERFAKDILYPLTST